MRDGGESSFWMCQMHSHTLLQTLSCTSSRKCWSFGTQPLHFDFISTSFGSACGHLLLVLICVHMLQVEAGAYSRYADGFHADIWERACELARRTAGSEARHDHRLATVVPGSTRPSQHCTWFQCCSCPRRSHEAEPGNTATVSYTHLTLPTIYSV